MVNNFHLVVLCFNRNYSKFKTEILYIISCKNRCLTNSLTKVIKLNMSYFIMIKTEQNWHRKYVTENNYVLKIIREISNIIRKKDF